MASQKKIPGKNWWHTAWNISNKTVKGLGLGVILSGEAFFTTLGRMGKFFWQVVFSLGHGGVWVPKSLTTFMRMGLLSVPLVTCTALFTGMVLALQSYASFAVMWQEVPRIVTLSFIKELGPVLCGLMMAGYWASAISAELATMRVTDQLDALRTLSANPVTHVVVPRIIAGLIALPGLTLLADIVGVFGGYVVAVYKYHIGPMQYLHTSVMAIHMHDVICGLVKAMVFGWVITFVGAYEGYYARAGAAGVGTATTRGVVHSCFGVLLWNYILTQFLLAP